MKKVTFILIVVLFVMFNTVGVFAYSCRECGDDCGYVGMTYFETVSGPDDHYRYDTGEWCNSCKYVYYSEHEYTCNGSVYNCSGCTTWLICPTDENYTKCWGWWYDPNPGNTISTHHSH